MDHVVIIGVSGGSASGKTTVARRIRECFEGSVEIISHDFYYLPYAELLLSEREQQNFDHPNAFDTELLIRHIKLLKQGIPVDRPVYVSFTVT